MANSQETTGEYVDGIVLNGVEHDIKDRTVSELAQDIDNEVINRQRAVSEEATARQNADNQLSTQISNEATARQNADNQLATSVNLIGTSVSNLSTSVASLSTAVESAVSDVNDMKSLVPSSASSSNKLADQNKVASDIDTAVRALDVTEVGGTGKYISTISESDGKILAIAETMDSTPTANSTKACTSGGIKDYVDTQIATAITQVLNTNF